MEKREDAPLLPPTTSPSTTTRGLGSVPEQEFNPSDEFGKAMINKESGSQSDELTPEQQHLLLSPSSSSSSRQGGEDLSLYRKQFFANDSGVGFTAATAGRETGRGRECDNDDDLENGKEKKREKEPPVDWERWEPIRTRILLLVSSSAFLAVMASSSVVPALDPIRESFDTTDTIVSLTSSLFFLSQGVFSLVVGPVSDVFSRRYLYLICLALYSVFSIACGLSSSIWMLIAFRVCTAVFSCPLVSLGAASISDIYPPAIRGRALGWFAISVLIGPTIGPVFGGLMTDFFGWRGLFYTSGALAVPIFLLQAFFLPETLDKTRTKPKYKPWLPMRLWFDPDVAPNVIGGSVVFGAVYSCYIIFGLVAEEEFGLSPFEVGLMASPIGLGTMIGSVVGGRLADYFPRKYGRGGRLVTVIFGYGIAPIPLIIFGFGLEVGVWIPVICLFFLGFCITLPRAGAMTFSIELNPRNAAAVAASFSGLQFILVFMAVSVAAPIHELVGIHWFGICVSPLILLLDVWVGVVMRRHWAPPDPYEEVVE